jgi:hypothetical protein
MNFRLTRFSALVAAAVLVWAVGAEATPRIQRLFTTRYPATVGSKLVKCVTCHEVKPPALNAYGRDLKAAHTRLAVIEKKDSDKDGFANLAEIKALTYPGDAKDKPALAPTDSGRIAPPDSAARDSFRTPPDSVSKAP